MIKYALSNRTYHLSEIRETVNNIFRNKLSKNEQIRRNAYKNESYVRKDFGIKTTKEICKMIENEISLAEKLFYEYDGNIWKCHSQVDTFTLNFDGCDCNLQYHAGIPCRHLIGLYKYTKNWFPVHFVYDRLTDDFSFNHTKFSDQINDIMFLEEEDSYDSDYVFEPESDDEFLYESTEDPYINDFTETFSKQKPIILNNYSELMQLSKEISKIGSSNKEMFSLVKNDLLNLMNKYSQAQRGEVICTGRRRGRPKTRGNSKFSIIGRK